MTKLREKNRSFQLAAAMLAVLALTAGCQKKEQAPVVKAPVKKPAAAIQAPMTTVKALDYVYVSSGKRDPFKSFVDQEAKTRRFVPATPLQSYDLEMLRLVGVMLLPNKKVAIIEDPTGKGYHVNIGTLIGTNGGKVVDILGDEVVVEEKYIDQQAETRTRRVSVRIPKEQGGDSR